MANKKVFCEECRNDVDYIVTQKEMVGTIRGKEYQYIGLEATCANCGAHVYVEEIVDSNLKALYEVYRKENGIISLEKVQAIPKRYSIGKRPLSNLLGWGEHTFTRFYDGDIPTKQYSKTLSHLYDDPNYYFCILENNKDRLSSKHAYEKSLKAVQRIINENKKYSNKINDAIQYFLYQCEDITPLALQKYLYYVQGFYYAFFGEYMFNDDCEAWTYGPVYKAVYEKYCNYHFNPDLKKENVDLLTFTPNEKDLIDCVIKYFCCYSSKILEEFTCSEDPWINTCSNISSTKSLNKIIEKELIANFFTKVKEKYNMTTPKDIRLYAKDMFNKYD